MEHLKIPLCEWKALYDAALEFRKIEPWEWMSDSDLFGVQNPKDGQIGYCCIMGGLGEVLGMAVYIGYEGLEGYKKIASGKIKIGDPDLLYAQDCLLVSYENKNQLKREDLQIAKLLGLSPTGRHAWPLFRSYRPGYFPWFLDGDEAVFLSHALWQAKEVCLRFAADSSIIHSLKGRQYLVRVPEQTETDIVWEDRVIKPASLKEKIVPEVTVDEFRLQKMKENIPHSSAVWEIDFFHAPTPVRESERPYFPYAMMIADQESGFIHDVFLTSPGNYHSEFLMKLFSDIEELAFLPMEIQVKKKEALRLFEPYAARLGIRIIVSRKLPSIDRARREMEKHFR